MLNCNSGSLIQWLGFSLRLAFPEEYKLVLRSLLVDPRQDAILSTRLLDDPTRLPDILDLLEKLGLVKLKYVSVPRRRRRPLRIYYYAVTKSGLACVA